MTTTSLSREGQAMVEQYLPLVHHVYNAMRPRLTCLPREDALQEGRLALVRAAADWRDGNGATFKTLAYRYIHNALINFSVTTRSKRRNHAKTVREGHEEAKVESRRRQPRRFEMDAVDIVRKAISRIPQRFRYLFEMKYLEGLTQREMGERLGISHKAVNFRLYHAKRKMKLRGFLLALLWYEMQEVAPCKA